MSENSHSSSGVPFERTLSTRDEIIRTHLEDLQAEMEAGSRTLDTIAERTAEMRTGLLRHHMEQANLAGALIRQVAELRQSVQQQRETLRALRNAIRQRKR